MSEANEFDEGYWYYPQYTILLALPTRIRKNSTRVRSTRAHSQQCTAAAGKYEYWRVRCGMAHSGWRILKFDFTAL